VPEDHLATSDAAYTERLLRTQGAWWKRIVDIRGIYGWNLRRLEPGYLLDVGCGIGRNLAHVRGHGVGVDHNPHSIEVCRQRGFSAFTPEALLAGDERLRTFDSMLLSHLVEHMNAGDAAELIRSYLPLVRPNGKIIVIVPQENGYRSDPTHVCFFRPGDVAELLDDVGVRVERSFSFPLPHVPFGQLFRYNEFVVIGRLSDAIETGG
jgi:SAM-dependent methyltransferase